jgi:hypothetical protein
MIDLYVYIGAGLLAGVVSEQWRARWRILLAMTGVAAIVLHVTWPHLHWDDRRVLETLLEGIYWYAGQAILVFVGPFLTGLYGRRLVRVIIRWRRRES